MRIIAYLRCAKTACAVERFRLKHGKLPEKLEKLVPEFLAEIPIDPFDGKNLRYFRGDFDVEYEIPIIPRKKSKAPEKSKKDEKSDIPPEFASVFRSGKEEEKKKKKNLSINQLL